MKRAIYIIEFILFGLFVAVIIHAGAEILLINLLTSDFDSYNLGLSWELWFLIPKITFVVFILIGVFIGYKKGKYWWQRVYENSPHIEK